MWRLWCPLSILGNRGIRIKFPDLGEGYYCCMFSEEAYVKILVKHPFLLNSPFFFYEEEMKSPLTSNEGTGNSLAHANTLLRSCVTQMQYTEGSCFMTTDLGLHPFVHYLYEQCHRCLYFQMCYEATGLYQFFLNIHLTIELIYGHF